MLSLKLLSSANPVGYPRACSNKGCARIIVHFELANVWLPGRLRADTRPTAFEDTRWRHFAAYDSSRICMYTAAQRSNHGRHKCWCNHKVATLEFLWHYLIKIFSMRGRWDTPLQGRFLPNFSYSATGPLLLTICYVINDMNREENFRIEAIQAAGLNVKKF